MSPAIDPPACCFEDEAAASGCVRIAGVDEAGRGPLAGPVVAAAVIIPYQEHFEELNDSKLLNPRTRERLFDAIMSRALAVGVGIVPPETIDRINIYQATRLAMKTAVGQILPPPDFLLIDGPLSLDLDMGQRPIVKGDRLSVSIAAASIVAKVTRDRLMAELHRQYPEYRFDEHKGYPTKAHKEAICRYGPSPAHRKCFRGVKEFLPLDSAETLF
ncbi:MAG: ribonuclease HII [Desulfomonile sp.]|nr:ribonuclease HII [Desulfomonile sp.]